MILRSKNYLFTTLISLWVVKREFTIFTIGPWGKCFDIINEYWSKGYLLSNISETKYIKCTCKTVFYV